MNRAQILDEAKRLTTGDRNRTYGPPGAQHQHAAEILSAITGREFTAEDMVLAMIAIKLSRLAVSPGHADTYLDLAAYSAILGEIATAAEDALA